jgi:RNase H-like domain found in reverse transcriptase
MIYWKRTRNLFGQKNAFDQLKKQFTEKPVLMMPDHSKPFQIQVDSSLFATGGILTQMDTNGDRHPCANLSKSLTKEQRNYDTGDRELLAIVQALKEWRHYIQGSGHTTIVLSDHDNPQHFKIPQTIGWQMAWWMLYLSEFDIKLVHIPGKKNIQANSLSQRPDLCLQGTDNRNVAVLPEHFFVNLIDMELQKKIANTKNLDYDAAKAIKELLEQGPREAKYYDFSLWFHLYLTFLYLWLLNPLESRTWVILSMTRFTISDSCPFCFDLIVYKQVDIHCIL